MLFDPIYWIIIGVSALLSFGASMLVKSAFKRGQSVPLMRQANGAQIAQAILDAEGIDDVEVIETRVFYPITYNPMSKQLALSPDVYHGTNAAAAGVAAHEVGHAIQHARSYAPLWMRSALVPMAQIGSFLGPWIIIAGIFLVLHRVLV